MPRARKENLDIKMRFTVTRRMSKDDALKAIHRTIKTRIVQEGIELNWMDWKRGEGGRGKEGEYLDADAHDALVNFYYALTDPETRTRIAVVDDDDVEREVLKDE